MCSNREYYEAEVPELNQSIPEDGRTDFLEIFRSSDISGKYLIDTSLPHTPVINRIRTSAIGLNPKPNFAAYSKKGSLDIEIELVNGPSDPRAILFLTAKTSSKIRINNPHGAHFALIAGCGGDQYLFLPRSFIGPIDHFTHSTSQVNFSPDIKQNLSIVTSASGPPPETVEYFHGRLDNSEFSTLSEWAGSSVRLRIEEGAMIHLVYCDEILSEDISKPTDSNAD
ncbi:hypothetical protein SISNIDRAFT_258926 [Sistotremastrum niveocremeum HHB9708]|uniref:DUF7330 domain-containing protein n=1 Tax=Sistotremastrum niveocremeum HHB9708 TaxID=1314777 RepID=A0A164P7Z6_9AGAM|nr:hypothetical protein SISNIDRAFT_258926 [Sistotremastrum niveocremeum HHB9708]